VDDETAEGEESAQLEAAEDSPSIETIAALSDDELMELLGMKKQLADVRKAIKELETLTGKAKEYAEERIMDWFTPRVDTYSFKYLAEDAKRAASKKDGKAALDDCSCGSVL